MAESTYLVESCFELNASLKERLNATASIKLNDKCNMVKVISPRPVALALLRFNCSVSKLSACQTGLLCAIFCFFTLALKFILQSGAVIQVGKLLTSG